MHRAATDKPFSFGNLVDRGEIVSDSIRDSTEFFVMFAGMLQKSDGKPSFSAGFVPHPRLCHPA